MKPACRHNGQSNSRQAIFPDGVESPKSNWKSFSWIKIASEAAQPRNDEEEDFITKRSMREACLPSQWPEQQQAGNLSPRKRITEFKLEIISMDKDCFGSCATSQSRQL